MSALQVTAEILSSLNLCHITVRCPDYLSTQEKLKISSDQCGVTVTLSDGREFRLNNPKGIEFIEADHEYTISEDRRFFSVRLPLTKKSCAVRCIVSDLASDIRSLLIKSPYDCLCKTDLVVTCAGCNAVVSKRVHFDRIRELPAVNWQQSSEEWFCHGHGNTFDDLEPETIVPKLRDCFFSDLFFQVKEEILVPSNHRTDCEDNAVCSRCNNVFGLKEKKDQQVKLWSHRVKWMTDEEPRMLLYSSNEISLLITLIDNLAVDSFGANSRIVFTKKSIPKIFLFMSVINSNLTLLTSNDRFEVRDDALDDQDIDHPDNGKRSQYSASKRRPKPVQFVDGTCEINLTKNNVIKVLYKTVREESDETLAWDDDINVNVFQCAESLFDALYTRLTDSTQGLEDQTLDRGMAVGYILRK